MRLSAKRVLGLIALVAVGCDDPAPKPAQPSATATATAIPTLQPLASTMRPRGGRLSDTYTKRLRAELCEVGLLGAIYAREAYFESLGGKAPSATHLPSFGEHGAMTERTGRLPFDRHLRACTAGARLATGKWPALDAALSEVEPRANETARLMGQASRYYARKEWEKDAFAEGNKSHEALTALTDLAEKHAAYRKVLGKWLGTERDGEDERNDAALQSKRAVTLARAVLDALLDGKAAKLDELRQLSQSLGEAKGGQRAVATKIDAFVKHAIDSEKLTSRQRYDLAMAYAALLEYDHGLVTRSTFRDEDPRKPAMSAHPAKRSLEQHIRDRD